MLALRRFRKRRRHAPSSCPSPCPPRRLPRSLPLPSLSLLLLLLLLLFLSFLLLSLLISLISPSHPSNDTTALLHHLHTVSSIPRDFLTPLPAPTLRTLRSLLTPLPASPSSNHASFLRAPPPRLLVLHLTSVATRRARLAALAGALAYARATDRVVLALWEAAPGELPAAAVAPQMRGNAHRRAACGVRVVIANVPAGAVRGAVAAEIESATANFAAEPERGGARLAVEMQRKGEVVYGRGRKVVDWAELGTAYVDSFDELDAVTALSGRHVYVRVDGDEDPFVSLRYGAPRTAAMMYGQCFHISEVPPASAALSWPRHREGEESEKTGQTRRQRGKDKELAGERRSGDGAVGNASGLASFAVHHRFPWLSARLGQWRGYELAAARLRVAEETVFAGRLIRDAPELDVSTELHDKFHVPNLFLSAMSSSARVQLLLRLRESESGTAVFVHTQYGLGNRLRALGSAMALAEAAGRVLVVIWQADAHLNTTFHDLFVNQDLIVLSKLPGLVWPPSKIRPFDSALAHVDFWNMMKLDGIGGKPVHNAIKVNVDPRPLRHLYIKSAYVVKSSLTPGILAVTSSYWQLLRDSLAPVLPVAALVDDPALAHVNNAVGVHIRGRTLDNDISGVNRTVYGAKSADVTDRWRRLTGVDTFATKIRRLKKSYRFFVAADTPDAIRALADEFGTDRISSLRYSDSCENRSVRCARLALADILLLARVRVILGSNWSSFSEAAIRLNPNISYKRILLAGVNFGRPPPPPRRSRHRPPVKAVVGAEIRSAGNPPPPQQQQLHAQPHEKLAPAPHHEEQEGKRSAGSHVEEEQQQLSDPPHLEEHNNVGMPHLPAVEDGSVDDMGEAQR